MARMTRGGARVGGLGALVSRLSARAPAVMVAAALAVSVLSPRVAMAEESSGSGKGIAGGALLGAELVVGVEALAGVESPWAYAIGGVLGAGGGGVGGYFIEQNAEARIPLYMLAGGMALVIPAAIVTLNATQYKPPVDYQEDQGRQDNEPVAEPPQPTQPPVSGPVIAPTSELTPAKRFKLPVPATKTTLVARPQFTPPSMLQVNGEGLRLGVPAVEVRPVYTQLEMRQYGVSQAEEVRIPVFGGVF